MSCSGKVVPWCLLGTPMTGFGLTKQLYINLAKQRLKSHKTDIFAYGLKLKKGADRRQRKTDHLKEKKRAGDKAFKKERKSQKSKNRLFQEGKGQEKGIGISRYVNGQ
jgi:hypothetical protein